MPYGANGAGYHVLVACDRVRAAVDAGDVDALREVLQADPALTTRLVAAPGIEPTSPLTYVEEGPRVSTAAELFQVTIRGVGRGVAATADELQWLLERVKASPFRRELGVLVAEAERALSDSSPVDQLLVGPIEIVGEEEASMLGRVLFRARNEGLALTPTMDELKHLLDDVAIDEFA